jgi:diguanylate cyclase (GGDEF)-like protein/PAS domain S-box-containing protein
MSVWSASSVRRRNIAYVALSIGLIAGSVPLVRLGWTGDAWIQTLLESIATFLAFVIGTIALVRYYAQKSVSYLFLGSAFLAAGIPDCFHAVITSPSCAACGPPSLLGLVSWSGYISHIFLSLVMCARLFAWHSGGVQLEVTRRRERVLYFMLAGCILGSFTFLQFVPLPLEYYPNFPIHRPAELVAGIFFGIAALGHWRKGAWKTVNFEHWLMLFLIAAIVGQLAYLPSIAPFDAARCVAHVLGIAAYVFVLAGLLSSMLSIFRGAERALADQRHVNASLACEVQSRQRAEEALEQARQKLEARVEASAQEIAQQDELATLASKIAVVLTQGDAVQETLQRAAEVICRSLDVALVRIWTLNREQNVLELNAGAGMYTGLDGPHRRVPVGQFRIGRVAQEGKPLLTNTIQEDPWVSDQEWAKREGMVAFAGYPLMVKDRVEGVIAACARRPLTEMTMQALGSIAGSLGLFIGRRGAEAALLESEERVRLLLDSTAEAIYGIDLDGNCTFANLACLRLLGYSTQQDLLGRNMHVVMHHSLANGAPYPVTECKIFRAFRRGEGSHVDDEVLWRADGTSFPAEYWSYPVVKAGEIVGSVVTFLDISARKQAEEEQRKLVSLVESSDDFIVMASPDRRVFYLNGGGARLIGLDSAQEAVGHPISSFHPEAAWAQIEATIPTQLKTGQFKCETLLRHWKTGAPIDVLLSAFTLRKPETGEVLCLAAVMRDITGRKQTEQALRTSEERFRILTENACDQTFDWNLGTGQTEVFGSKSRLGDQPAPLSFEAWKSMIHPDDVAGLLEAIDRHIQTGERYVGEYRVMGRKGDVYYYSLRGQAIRNGAGEPVRWVGLVNDVTEQKKAAESIAQLAAIVQSSEDAIIGAGLSGIITTWNGGAQKLLGHSSAEALGKPISALLADQEQAVEFLERCARGDVSRFDQTFLQCKQGALLPVSLTVTPIRNAMGEVTNVAAIARDVSAQIKADAELAYQARHDHLTGLPNRLMLADRLEASIARAAASGLMAALIYLDLDGFKLVNDTLGHEAGDQLLQQVTDRLRACVRDPDTLARMGGDEFMLLINDVNEDQTALAIAERMGAALRKPCSVAGHDIFLTASMGISMYPRDGTDVSTLRRNADAAMYQAKHAGKDRALFFTPTMQTRFLERLEMETDLRHAFDNGEFFLHFQPIFEASECRQTAFEALIRWMHPTRDLIPPGEFIPVAEETGLITRLGPWVLREACRECRFWQDHGLDSVRVTVNVSPLEFTRADFAESVLRLLDEAGLGGHLLELELTEGVVMRDVEGSIRKMTRLRERGVRLSIDDFGTGYSSLGYLARLPVDTLKIDRSFVAELGINATARSFIEGMLSMAHSIGKRVIVEGVETEQQLATLRELGVDEVQGFLLGRPALLPNFDELRGMDGLERLAAGRAEDPAELLESTR